MINLLLCLYSAVAEVVTGIASGHRYELCGVAHARVLVVNFNKQGFMADFAGGLMSHCSLSDS